jgi:hypothetical protein
MKSLFRALLLALAFCSLSANAGAIYSFSYTFDDSSTVSGTLNGKLNGDFVTNITDVHVLLNGTEFSGNLFQAAWNGVTGDWDNSAGARLSFNAALNNFIFADANLPGDTNVSNYFYFLNDAALGAQTFVFNDHTSEVALDAPYNDSWRLAVVVPEPATGLLVFTGLGLLGALHRRQQK